MKYFVLSCFLFLCVLTYFSVKRIQAKGIVSKGYISLLIFSIGSLCLGSFYMLSLGVIDVYTAFSSGETYKAHVVEARFSHVSESDNGRRTNMYTPIVSFTTDEGQDITTELDFSTSGVEEGDIYKINYNEKTGKIIALGFPLVLKIIISLIFSFILGLLFMGIIKYAFGLQMTSFKDFALKSILFYFIPFIMILFDLLLIYALFYGNPVPIFVSLLLVFFILMLTLGIIGYIKQVINPGKAKNKKVIVNRRNPVVDRYSK